MPPRLSLRCASRSLAIRSATRPSIAQHTPLSIRALPFRASFADSKAPQPNTNPASGDGLPQVSEEAAQLNRIIGGETNVPDLEQGTPVQEILKRNPELAEQAPEVLKEEIKQEIKQEGKEDAPGAEAAADTSFDNLLALGQMEAIAHGGFASDVTESMVGHKFPLPELPLPPFSNRKERYDTVVDQVTNLIMKDGKLSVAQRHMSFILNHLRTAPPPTPSESRPLLPGSPPPAQLPLNPILYLTLAVDSLAPLLRIRNQKGAAGGGAALQIPVPLSLRQRRRQAVMWILDAADKKKSRGSGRGMFAQRIADEVVNVVEGKSNAWEKRAMVHKVATAARANLNYKKGGFKR